MSATTAPGGLRRRLVEQFHRPHGLLGQLAGFILSHRQSNLERNRWTVELLAIQPDDRVLELGFGPGVSIASASRLAHRGRVVGVDHSATMLRMASRRNAAAIRQGRVRLFEASLDRLPVSADAFAEPFDKIFAVNALQFAADSAPVVRALRERLSDAGLIAITQQSRKPDATDRDSIQAAERVGDLLQDSGFTNVRIETLPLKPACAACAIASAT